MFGFLKPQLTVEDDPLQSPETACAWLNFLPPQDVAGRHRQVLTALHDIRRVGASIDRDRIEAIALVDAAIDADRRRLIAQYVVSVDRSAALSERIWQSMDELNKAFTVAYRIALDAVSSRPRASSCQSLIALLLARLIRCFGNDGKLHAFRYQRRIPAKWRELHQLYRYAQQRGIERVPLTENGPQPQGQLVHPWRCAPSRQARASLPSDGQAEGSVIEQEYLCVLLDDRIDTGNLSPAEFEILSQQLRDWRGELALDTAPRAAGGFVVDIAGHAGLVRRTGSECGATLRFVDSTPLVARFRQEIVALKRPRLASREAEQWGRQPRISILEKTLPSIATTSDPEARRHRREPAAAKVAVCVGIVHIYDALAAEDRDAGLGTVLAKHYRNDTLNWPRPMLCNETTTAVSVNQTLNGGEAQALGMRVVAKMAKVPAKVEQIEVRAVGRWTEDTELSTAAGDRAVRTGVRCQSPPSWTVVDRSATGLRLRVSGSVAQELTAGALVAVLLSSADSSWILGAVRRVCRMTCDIVEVGVSIFADRVVAATLHSQCPARADMHFVVDGIDVSAMGATFHGVYIPAKTQSASSRGPGTLIIATSNYDTGRRVLLAADDDVHALVLREPIEQHADWTCTAIEVAPRLAHEMM
jgi:hypothetical protein